MPTAAIALGSNLGDRHAAIASALRALEELPRTRVVRASAPIETDPVGPGRQDKYLNAAAILETTLKPRELLESLLKIERSLGRVRDPAQQWGPRTLDIDLLLYADQVIHEPGLSVPHPRMHERRFVLEPLSQVAPDLRHPTLGKSVAELLRGLD